MNQYKTLFYMVLALITGASAGVIFFLGGGVELAHKPVAILFFISSVGHMTSFLSNIE